MAGTDSSQRDKEATAERSVGFGVALLLCVLTAAVLLAGAWGGIARTPPLSPGERINPNTAPVSSLARLPRIGWSRAQAVITYRQQRLIEAPGAPVFLGPGDLTQVPGLGPRTVEAISAWLDFDPVRTEPPSPLSASLPGR